MKAHLEWSEVNVIEPNGSAFLLISVVVALTRFIVTELVRPTHHNMFLMFVHLTWKYPSGTGAYMKSHIVFAFIQISIFIHFLWPTEWQDFIKFSPTTFHYNINWVAKANYIVIDCLDSYPVIRLDGSGLARAFLLTSSFHSTTSITSSFDIEKSNYDIPSRSWRNYCNSCWQRILQWIENVAR